MTAEIVNLRRVRKDKARQDKTKVAAENREKHGRTSAERERQAIEAGKAAAYLDGHRRDFHRSDGEGHAGSGDADG